MFMGTGMGILSNSIRAKHASTGTALPVHLGKLLTPTNNMVLVVAVFEIQKIRSQYLLSPAGER